jgi:tetratricopeptide (TPR) repeat protein
MTGKFKIALTILVTASLLTGCSRKYDPVETYNRGYAEYVSGNSTRAIGYYKWALELKKEYPAPMIGLARCYHEMAMKNFADGNPGAALQDLEEALYWANLAIDAAPGNAQATQVRVEIMKLRGDVEAAVRTAQWGTRVQGPNAKSLLLMAKTYMDVGAYDEAQVSIRQAIAVDPYNVEVRKEAAGFYEKLGKPDLAREQYEEIYRLDQANQNAQKKIGADQQPQENVPAEAQPQEEQQ